MANQGQLALFMSILSFSIIGSYMLSFLPGFPNPVDSLTLAYDPAQTCSGGLFGIITCNPAVRLILAFINFMVQVLFYGFYVVAIGKAGPLSPILALLGTINTVCIIVISINIVKPTGPGT